MAGRIDNLKHFAHPARNREGEGSPADNRADRAGAKRSGMSMKQWESSPQDAAQDAVKPSMSAPKTDPPLSAEQRFYRSAKPAPVKGIR